MRPHPDPLEPSPRRAFSVSGANDATEKDQPGGGFLPLARQRSPGRKKGGLTRSGKGPGAVLRREAPPPRPAGFPHPSGAVGFDVGQACHGFVATAFLGLHEGLQAVDLGLQAGDHDGMLRGL